MERDDLISRAAAIAEIGKLIKEYRENEKDEMADGMIIARRYGIKQLPAVDAVPVVRCKDCKHRPVDHRDEYNEVTGFSIEFPDNRCPCQCEDGWYNWYPQDDWFCANGERKEDA